MTRSTDPRPGPADAGRPTSPGQADGSASDYPVVWSLLQVPAGAFTRGVVRTPWFGAGDDLPTAVRGAVEKHVRVGDTVAVSEKVAVVLTGAAIEASTIRVGRIARVLARGVRPIGNSRGLSIPEKMQFVHHRVGTARLLGAAALSLLARPLGRTGVFSRVAGSVARDLDGMRPPYEGHLIPPLSADAARTLADRLEGVVGAGVAIVDVNDRGGSVRACSASAMPAPLVLAALSDNPMGQRRTSTPIVVLRRVR